VSIQEKGITPQTFLPSSLLAFMRRMLQAESIA
jgi:hypothetical protein